MIALARARGVVSTLQGTAICDSLECKKDFKSDKNTIREGGEVGSLPHDLRLTTREAESGVCQHPHLRPEHRLPHFVQLLLGLLPLADHVAEVACLMENKDIEKSKLYVVLEEKINWKKRKRNKVAKTYVT